MSDATNAVVAKPLSLVGGIYVAPLGTTLPKNATAKLPAAWLPLGYITSDGVDRKLDKKSDTINAWGGDILATTVKSTSATVQFAAAEYLNPDSQRIYYGDDNVKYTAGSNGGGTLEIHANISAPAPKVSLVIDIRSDTATGRIVYPIWQASDIDDVKLIDDDLTALNLTGTLFPDTDGCTWHEYWIKNPNATATSSASTSS